MWTLHSQLAADCHELFVMDGIHVLLKKEKIIPWFILVPETHYRDVYELEPHLYGQVLALIKKISLYSKVRLSADKINVAEIGNVVPQMHIHIVARRIMDPLWPGVVWGQLLDQQVYNAAEVIALRDDLQQWFAD